MHAKRNGYSFSYREVNFFRSSMDLCIKEIQQAKSNGKTVVILTGNKNNEKQMKELINQKIGLDLEGIIIEQGELSTGFECYDFNLLVISAKELFANPKKKRKTSLEFKQGETVIFSDLKVRRLRSAQNKWNRIIYWCKYYKSRWNNKRLYQNKI